MESHRDTASYFTALQSGEEAGFDYFFRLHYPPLLQYATGMLKSGIQAEDTVQDAFVILWEKRHTLQNADGLKAYLFRVVHNKCLALLKAARKESNAQPLLIALTDATEKDTAITHELIRAELMYQVYGAIKTLPAQAAKVFRLFYYEGKSYTEIAEELQLSVSTIRNQKARALYIIRKHIFGLWFYVLSYFLVR